MQCNHGLKPLAGVVLAALVFAPHTAHSSATESEALEELQGLWASSRADYDFVVEVSGREVILHSAGTSQPQEWTKAGALPEGTVMATASELADNIARSDFRWVGPGTTPHSRTVDGRKVMSWTEWPDVDLRVNMGPSWPRITIADHELVPVWARGRVCDALMISQGIFCLPLPRGIQQY